jgi:hypothetical protein
VLRITRENGADSTRIAAEGRLVGEWVGVLREELERCESAGRAVSLDLSRVHYADTAGSLLLRTARARGIAIVGSSPLLATLLASGEG